jgi:hypothetical protein
MLSRLGQNLNGYVFRDQILLDQGAEKLIFGLGCCREANLDLFETNFHKKFEELYLLFQAHRNDKRLVSVTQVNAAPYRCFLDAVFFCPVHARNRRHIVLFLILLYIHHDFLLSESEI